MLRCGVFAARNLSLVSKGTSSSSSVLATTIRCSSIQLNHNLFSTRNFITIVTEEDDLDEEVDDFAIKADLIGSEKYPKLKKVRILLSSFCLVHFIRIFHLIFPFITGSVKEI
jgi:hypothetical protein